MENDQDQMELKSVEVFDPVQKRHYSVFVPGNLEILHSEDNLEDEEEQTINHADNSQEPATTWSQNETLALINIFSLHKDKFKHFKMKKDRWKLISKELSKIGIDKLPVKCEIKWRNLLRTYRTYKTSDRAQGKFEFYNEINDIIANDPQYKNLFEPIYTPIKNDKIITKPTEIKQLKQDNTFDISNFQVKRKRCFSCKSEKQKRHEERMALLKKKLELEERKVVAFEDYIKFLKTTHKTT
ncbi:uncharacterized protein LOC130897269 [Diorhabda carinulata]|uniref:uncharacterized protein LOC130441208 n=1 Tax=Diorhabda sublineata TaxID=1163346 RepID=UPI0024E0D1E2|nr:uncharacterized protein LOC130441208 [Diorhabda sublineata]XP_057662017.1 uncharacterized protein LOC130897269 [Diorhabda carinulata]